MQEQWFSNLGGHQNLRGVNLQVKPRVTGPTAVTDPSNLGGTPTIVLVTSSQGLLLVKVPTLYMTEAD